MSKITARELIEMLLKMDLDAEVILQKDSEGNGYSPLAGADGDAIYIADTTWSGEVYDTTQTAQEACMDEEDWKEFKHQPRCIVLWPIN